jgi:Ni/Co efflux regulator RcnB
MKKLISALAIVLVMLSACAGDSSKKTKDAVETQPKVENANKDSDDGWSSSEEELKSQEEAAAKHEDAHEHGHDHGHDHGHEH